MDINEVARTSGVPASALRYYEEKGLIASVGRHGLRRLFGPGVLERLALITLGRNAGFALDDLAALFDNTRHHGFPVLDRAGSLYGMVTLSDLQHSVETGLPPDTPTERITTRELVVVHPDQSLNEALRRFAQADVGRIPVVARANPRELLGVLRRSDIVKAYNRGAMQRVELEHRLQHMRASSHSGAHLVEITLQPGGSADGRAVRELQLPQQTIITAIRRDGRTIIPRGETILRGGDQLTLLAHSEHSADMPTSLMGGAAADAAPRYHDLVLPPDAPAVGRLVAELGLPPGALIVALRRGGQTHTVHGRTQLAAGDELTVLAPGKDLAAIMRCLLGDAAVERRARR